MLHKEKGLQAKDTRSIINVVVNHCMKDYAVETPIIFNPMGMALFDIAVGAYYLEEAKKRNIGHYL